MGGDAGLKATAVWPDTVTRASWSPGDALQHGGHVLTRERAEANGPRAIQLLPELSLQPVPPQDLFGVLGVSIARGAVVSEVDAEAFGLDRPDRNPVGAEAAASLADVLSARELGHSLGIGRNGCRFEAKQQPAKAVPADEWASRRSRTAGPG